MLYDAKLIRIILSALDLEDEAPGELSKATHFYITDKVNTSAPKELLDDQGLYKDTFKFIGIYPLSHGYTFHLIQVF